MLARRAPAADFGQWLDITLSNKGILSRTIAEACGVTESAVSKWRRPGASVPDVAYLAKIADVLGLDPTRLAVTAGVWEVEGVTSYPMPEPNEAQRESVRRQIARIRGLSAEGRTKLLETYDELMGNGGTP